MLSGNPESMIYVDEQPQASGYYWVDGDGDERIVHFDGDMGEVEDAGAWVDVGVFEAQFKGVRWSDEAIDKPDC